MEKLVLYSIRFDKFFPQILLLMMMMMMRFDKIDIIDDDDDDDLFTGEHHAACGVYPSQPLSALPVGPGLFS